MALMSKRNSFFSFEESDVVGAAVEPINEEEIREQEQAENEIESEIATVEEEGEVVEALAEQYDDNQALIENAPEQVTEEIVTESNKQYLLALGRLGMGTDQLRYIKIGTESSLSPLENLKINQEGIVQTIKDFFARIWDWIKKMAGKIKDFIVGIGQSLKRLAARAGNLINKKLVTPIVDFVKKRNKPLEALASLMIENDKTIIEIEDLMEICFISPRITEVLAGRQMPTPALVAKTVNKAADGKPTSFLYVKLNGNKTNVTVGDSSGYWLKDITSVDTGELSNEDYKKALDSLVTSEAARINFLRALNTKSVKMQEKDAKSIENVITGYKNMIKKQEDQLKNITDEENSAKAKEAIAGMNNTIKVVSNIGAGHIYIQKVFAALIDLIEKATKESGNKKEEDK